MFRSGKLRGCETKHNSIFNIEELKEKWKWKAMFNPTTIDKF